MTLAVVAPAHGTATLTPRDPLPKRAVVAAARGRVAVYRYPGARSAFIHYTKTNSFGQPRVFLVARRRPGWEKVYLPKRPDGSTGWVRDRSVALSYDPYGVLVSLGQHKIWSTTTAGCSSRRRQEWAARSRRPRRGRTSS